MKVTNRHACILNQSGAIPILTVVTLAFLVLSAAIGIDEYLQSGNNEFIQFRMNSGSDALSSQLSRYASLGSTFRSSLNPALTNANNADLANCVVGDSTGVNLCVAVDSQNKLVQHQATIYFPDVKDPSGVTNQILAGPVQSSPALYDMYGAPYLGQLPLPTYLQKVSATFTATCLGGAASCSRAQSVTLHFTVSRPSPVSLQKNILSQVDGPEVQITSILPPLQGSASGNKTVQVLPASVPNPILALLAAAGSSDTAANQAWAKTGITDPGVINNFVQLVNKDPDAATKFATALATSHLTNPVIVSNLLIDGIYYDDYPPSQAIAIGQAASNAGVTNEDILIGLIDSAVTDSSLASAINLAVSSTGITNKNVLNALAYSGITDPVLLKQIGSALLAADPQMANNPCEGCVMEALAAAKVTDPFIITAFSNTRDYATNGGNTETLIVTSIASAITDANVKNPTVAAAIASANNALTAAQATQINSVLLAAGLDGSHSEDQAIANALVASDAPGSLDRATITAMINAMRASGVTDYDVLLQASYQEVTTVSGITAIVNQLATQEDSSDNSESASRDEPEPVADGGTVVPAPIAPSGIPSCVSCVGAAF